MSGQSTVRGPVQGDGTEIGATEGFSTEQEGSSGETPVQETPQTRQRQFPEIQTQFASLPRYLVIGSIVTILLILLLHTVALGILLFAGDCSESQVVATLLSSGLSIIGVALATWAGLNISNAVNAAHLSALQNDTYILQDTIADIRSETATLRKAAAEQNNDLAHSLEERAQATFRRMFLNEISCIWCDLPLQELLFLFNQISTAPFDQLVKIELMYSQCFLRSKSEYSYDEFLIRTAQQAINEIEKVKEECSDSKTVECYLEYRKYSLLFYMGYCDETYEKSAMDFMALIEGHTKLMQCFRDAQVRLSPESKCYLSNMIGEARSKIVYYHLCMGGSKTPEIIAIANQAVEDCEKSCGPFIALADDTLRSTYYRDYGCALERRERLTGEDEHEKIIEVYEQALRCLINDVTGDIAARKNAYYVLLSYYKKYVDRNVKYIKKDGKNIIDIKETLKNIADFSSDLTKTAKKMARISIIAMSDFPNISSMHAYYGFSCAYQAVLELKNKNYESTKKYIAEIEAIKADIELMGVNDLFCEQLGQWAVQLQKECDTERAEDDGRAVPV